MTLHPKLIDRRRVVHAHLLLLSVVPDSHTNVVATSLAPDVVRHLKTDDENAQVQFPGPLAQCMSAQELVESTHLRIIVRRVILILALAFTHLDESRILTNQGVFEEITCVLL